MYTAIKDWDLIRSERVFRVHCRPCHCMYHKTVVTRALHIIQLNCLTRRRQCTLNSVFRVLTTQLHHSGRLHSHVCIYLLQTLKDWKLAIGVLVMVTIDLIILVPLTIVEWFDGFEPEEVLDKENPTSSDEVNKL